MSERFSRLFLQDKNLYSDNAPVIIEAGAILKDNETDKIFAQLKLVNMSGKNISAVFLQVKCYDITGKEIEGVKESQLLDLNIAPNVAFASKNLILLPEKTTRKIKGYCTNVVFTDGTTWENKEDAWESIACEPFAGCFAPDIEKEFLRQTHTTSAKVKPQKLNGVWICTCGKINGKSFLSCPMCKAKRDVLFENFSADVLLEKKLNRENTPILDQAKEALDKQSIEALANIIPQLEAIGEWKNTAELLELCKTTLAKLKEEKLIADKDAIYNAGVAALNGNSIEALDKAVEQLAKIPDWKDSAELLAKCKEKSEELKAEEAIRQKNFVYDEAVKLMSVADVKKIADAKDIFVNLKDWKDSAQKADECDEKIKQIKEAEAKRKKKIIKFSAIAAACLAVVLGIVFTISGVVNHNMQVAREEDYKARNGLVMSKDSSGDFYVVTGMEKEQQQVAIPSFYNGKPVIAIAADAFFNSAITQVDIGDNVLSIGDNAFAGCGNLSVANFGNRVINIYNSAFSNCSKLQEVTLPESLTAIGDNAFSGCSNLTNIAVPQNVTSMGDEVFAGCGGLKSASIPDSITSIGNGLFSWCSNIESMKIPKGVTAIGDNAFNGCSRLKDVSVPDSVTSIGAYAFSSCSGVNSLVISKRVTSIGHYAFSGCKNLTDLSIESSSTSIGENAFSGCPISHVIIPASAISFIPKSVEQVNICDGEIKESAFVGYEKLKNVTIGKGVFAIKDNAFKGCDGLVNITVENNQYYKDIDGVLYTIDGKQLIRYPVKKQGLDFTVPANVTKICEGAFSGCGLKNLTIPDGIESIGLDAFSGCLIETAKIPALAISAINKSNLKSIEITSGNSIEEGALSGCGKLESLTIPFVGDRAGVKSTDTYQYPLGYIFGRSRYTGSTATTQYCYINKRNLTRNYYIPSSLKRVVVTGGNINHGAFSGCSNLTSVTISDGAVGIASYAFRDCRNLTSVTIPNSLTSIGVEAFRYCSSLTSIVIPNSVTNIREYAFDGCSSLTSITIGDSVTSIGYQAFRDCPIETAKIPALACSYIPKSNLKNVKITSGNSIEEGALSGCGKLESITIPFVGAKAGVKSTDTYQYPFGYIFGVSPYTGGTATNQYYYGSSTSSRTSTMYYIPASLRSVTVTGGNMLYGAFSGCSKLTSITIPDGVTSIEGSVFEGCSTLESITIPDAVTSIGSSAFSSCSKLTIIIIPDGVTSIGNYAFIGCSALTGITIPDGVTNIGKYAFSDCSSLTSITIPDSVTSIGSYAFWNCSSLTSITIPDSVTSIGSSAFSGCRSLTGITIPDSVTSIGSSAFSGCRSLTSITIPDSVTSIGSSAFYECANLTSITIPAGVTSIGYYTFYGCSSLTSATFKNTSGWKVNNTALSSTALADPTTAATYLKSTYYKYSWTRS